MVHGRAFEVAAMQLDLGVVEKDSEFALVAHAFGISLAQRPGDQVAVDLLQIMEAGGSLCPEPFAQGAGIGAFGHAQKLGKRGVGTEPFGIGQPGTATAQAEDELRADQLRAVSAFLIAPGVESGGGLDLVPEAKLSGHRVDGDESAMGGKAIGFAGFELELGA